MSAGINATNGDNSEMPGGYESWPAPAARKAPFPATGRTPFPDIPSTSRIPPSRGPMVPKKRPVRVRSHRRRSPIPKIVIEQGHRCHSSWGRDRIITIPLDRRPTLGLRGPPRRYIEIERIPCRRRRKHRYECCEYEHDHPPPPQQQQPVMIANSNLPQGQPIVNMNTVAPKANPIANLTVETINNLPRQTIHLPAIHLPGSQADESTELETIAFPAEIINPVDGTLSIIQNNQSFLPSIQPQLINIPAAAVPSRGVPLSPAMTADPFAQRFRDLFQRLTLAQSQPTNPPVIQSTMPNTTTQNNSQIIRPTLPTMTEFNPAAIRPNINTPSTGTYPSANIRPINPGSYPRANITPAAPSNTSTYRPSNFTPSTPTNNPIYRPSNSSDIGPYQRANITPYASNVTRPAYSPPSTSTTRSGPFTPFPSLAASSAGAYGHAPSPPPSSSNPIQSISSTPKSILRNPLSTNPSDTVYTNLTSNDTIRKTARFD